MANISPKSNLVDVEISKNFNIATFCSDNETFDTDTNAKPWLNKARRKFYLQILSQRLKNYELKLPKKDRGRWNNKIAVQYVPKIHDWVDLGYATNKYGEIKYERTDEEARPGPNYNHSSNIGNQKRWNRLQNCFSQIKEVTDITNNQKIYKATYKCNDKLCGNCSQIRSIVAVTKYKNKVQAMINPVMLVLHQKSPAIGKLKETINAMYKDWRHILKVRAKNKKENYNGVCALEVTTNEEKQTYHPHYHIIIEKHLAKDLLNAWISADPQNRELWAHQNKQTDKIYSELPIDDKGNYSIKELFKYAMKMSVTNQETPNNKKKTMASTEMIYEIAKALQGVQQWRPFGNFRQTQNTKEISKAIYNEMVCSATEWPHIKLSKTWQWNKQDWEASDIPGLNLTNYKPTTKDIVYMGLSQQETNNFTNENQKNLLHTDLPEWNNFEAYAKRL